MEIKGKVIEKLPLRSGVSARGPWSISSLVVEFMDGQYTNCVCLENMKNAGNFESIAVGATGTFSFSVSSRKAPQGKWFTTCSCYKWVLDAPVDDYPV